MNRYRLKWWGWALRAYLAVALALYAWDEAWVMTAVLGVCLAVTLATDVVLIAVSRRLDDVRDEYAATMAESIDAEWERMNGGAPS